MAVRFITTWEGYKPGDVATFSGTDGEPAEADERPQQVAGQAVDDGGRGRWSRLARGAGTAEPARSRLAVGEHVGAPDAIVTDPFLSAAALAAEALDVPLAVGDTLVLVVGQDFDKRNNLARNFVVVGRRQVQKFTDARKGWLATATFVAVIGLSAVGLVDFLKALLVLLALFLLLGYAKPADLRRQMPYQIIAIIAPPISRPALTALLTAGMTWAGPRWMASSWSFTSTRRIFRFWTSSSASGPPWSASRQPSRTSSIVSLRYWIPFVMSMNMLVPSIALTFLASSLSIPAAMRASRRSTACWVIETSPCWISFTTSGFIGSSSR